MSTRKQLKALAEARRGMIVPGAFNAPSAKVIEDLGYQAIYALEKRYTWAVQCLTIPCA
jgi:2-methylisocitrate lyase-like PEP mutase family enzyme